MAQSPLLWLAGYLAALGLGWALAQPPTDDLVAPVERVTVPSFEPEGLQLAMAVGDFRGLGLVAPIEEAAAGEDEEDAPTIDVATQLRRDLTAVVHSGQRPVLWVVDPEAELGRRAVRRGQEYRDGWSFVSLAGNEIVLRKTGAEDLRVPIVGEAPATAEPEPDARAQQRERRRRARD